MISCLAQRPRHHLRQRVRRLHLLSALQLLRHSPPSSICNPIHPQRSSRNSMRNMALERLKGFLVSQSHQLRLEFNRLKTLNPSRRCTDAKHF